MMDVWGTLQFCSAGLGGSGVTCSLANAKSANTSQPHATRSQRQRFSRLKVKQERTLSTPSAACFECLTFSSSLLPLLQADRLYNNMAMIRFQ